MATQQLLRLPQLHATDLTRVHLAPGRNREPVVIKAFCAHLEYHNSEREVAALLRLQAHGVDCAPRLLAQLTMRVLDVDVPVLAIEYFPPACHLEHPTKQIELSRGFFRQHPQHQAAVDAAVAQARAAGVEHDDVEPRNIVCTRDASGALHFKLIDWACAVMLADTDGADVEEA